jgi:hypothetical protein
MPDLTRDELAATLTIAGTEFILFPNPLPLPAPPDWDGSDGKPEAIRPPVPRGERECDPIVFGPVT